MFVDPQVCLRDARRHRSRAGWGAVALSFGRVILMWNGLSSVSRDVVCFVLRRVGPEVRRLWAVEQAAGPGCQGWSARRAKPEDERPLTLGWRLLRHRRARRRWWGSGPEACRTRQPVVDRATASLMYAGRDRSVCMRRSWPHSVFASGGTG